MKTRMTVKELIKKLKTLKQDKTIMISNNRDCPAYDYEGQRFYAGFDDNNKTITIEGERGDKKTPSNHEDKKTNQGRGSRQVLGRHMLRII
jgi:hypothetical protein